MTGVLKPIRIGGVKPIRTGVLKRIIWTDVFKSIRTGIFKCIGSGVFKAIRTGVFKLIKIVLGYILDLWKPVNTYFVSIMESPTKCEITSKTPYFALKCAKIHV